MPLKEYDECPKMINQLVRDKANLIINHTVQLKVEQGTVTC